MGRHHRGRKQEGCRSGPCRACFRVQSFNGGPFWTLLVDVPLLGMNQHQTTRFSGTDATKGHLYFHSWVGSLGLQRHSAGH